jgi:hypothetical protein
MTEQALMDKGTYRLVCNADGHEAREWTSASR